MKTQSLKAHQGQPAEASKRQEPTGTEIPSGLERAGKASLAISGMWCAGCAHAVERVLERQPGVMKASVSFAAEIARVEWDVSRTTLAKIIEGASTLRYGLSTVAKLDEHYRAIEHEIKSLRLRLTVGALFSLWTMLAPMLSSLKGVSPETRFALIVSSAVSCGLVIAVAGWPFLKMAWRSLRAGVPGMDFLVSLGSLSAFLLSLWNLQGGTNELYFDAASMIVVLLLAGRLVEHAARRKSRSAVHTLLSEAPNRATVVDETGKEQRLLVGEIRKGSRIRVRPGARFALDGLVVKGSSHVDNSLLTGEAMPQPVKTGDVVLAGAINQEGELLVEVQSEEGSRRIDRISENIREMLAGKSRYEAAASFFARRLVLLVVPISLVSAAICLALGGTPEEALLRAVSVIVITCPCALGLATPMALLVALGRAASFGIVFRDGETLEQLASVDSVYFDKTGTLTQGRAYVSQALPAPGVSRELLLLTAAKAEAGSEHPLARAIRQAAPTAEAPSGSGETVPGKGLVWRGDEGDVIIVGSAEFLQEQGVAVLDSEPSEGTSVHTAKNGSWLGVIVLDDTLREGTQETLKDLRDLDLVIGILTGDSEKASLRFAEMAGLERERTHFRLSPEEKAVFINKLAESGRKPAYVGEGLNDGPALGAAVVGMAVQGACDLALVTAPVVLQSGGIIGVYHAIRLARRTRRVMKQNLFLAFVYNALAIPLAAAGMVSPFIAAIAMVLSSLSVTLNSLRLRAQSLG